ncbi:MAG: HK97 family phage prohead protease [Lachnospiraceae bacterium]|nr:HK97 family phage prohead protease [Lachnospiraceae bacterium]
MKETRITEIRAAEPTADGASALVLVGRPILYDTPTTIKDESGSYTEIIGRGALDNADLTDVRLLYNHDLGKVPLARTPKTMTLWIDESGLSFKAVLPETEAAKEIYEAVKRGDLSGMSFAFTVPEGGDTYDATTNKRVIRQIAKVYECSVVPYPAYPTTSIEARSMRAAALKTMEAKRQAKILFHQIMKVR